jgi:hypothetical protein
MLLLLILVLTLVVVGIGGWSADSRDTDYGLWPMHRPDGPSRPATPAGRR